jgi:hypothetical protein
MVSTPLIPLLAPSIGRPMRIGTLDGMICALDALGASRRQKSTTHSRCGMRAGCAEAVLRSADKAVGLV